MAADGNQPPMNNAENGFLKEFEFVSDLNADSRKLIRTHVMREHKRLEKWQSNFKRKRQGSGFCIVASLQYMLTRHLVLRSTSRPNNSLGTLGDGRAAQGRQWASSPYIEDHRLVLRNVHHGRCLSRRILQQLAAPLGVRAGPRAFDEKCMICSDPCAWLSTLTSNLSWSKIEISSTRAELWPPKPHVPTDFN